MDSGRKRTYGNQLAIRREADYNVVASTVRYLYMWELGEPMHTATVPSHAELDAYLSEHPGIRDSAQIGTHVAALVPVPPRAITVVHYLTSKRHPTKAAQFFEQLANGTDLHAGSPIHTLRERLIRSKASGDRLTIGEYVAYCVLAWNAYTRGRSITKLQLPKGGLSNSNFPQVG